MGCWRSEPERVPTVVIIGGGFGGILAARLLEEKYRLNVVLIERKQYFYFSFAALRAVTNPKVLDDILIPYSNLLRKGFVVQGEVEDVMLGNKLKVKGIEELIEFDYLIAATGIQYAFPSRLYPVFPQQARERYLKLHEEIKESKKVVLVGGGAVGIELTGDLAYYFPDLKITLIHGHDHLLPGGTTIRFKEELLRQLRGFANVEVILNDRVVLDEDVAGLKMASELTYIKTPKKIRTEKGLELEADLLFFCGGGKPANELYQKHFGSKLDEEGRLKVNQFLQVEGEERIFALGDCANVNETKRGASARVQARHVAANIARHAKEQSLKSYKTRPPGAIISIGRRGGASQPPLFPWLIIGPFLVSLSKRENFGAKTTWKLLRGQKAPSFDQQSFEIVRRTADSTTLAEILKISQETALKLLEKASREFVK